MARVKKNKRGPTKYRSEYAGEAMRVCASSGATTEGLAKHFEVSEKTVRNWKKRHKDFRRAVERGLKEFRRGCPPEQWESGRESLYEDGYAELARELASMGADVKKLAEALRVSPRTIYHWMRNRPDFKAAVEEGCKQMAYEIQASYLRAALPHDEETVRETKDGTFKTTRKGVIDTKAAERALETFLPEIWGKQVGLKHGVDDELADILKRIDGKTKGLPSESSCSRATSTRG
ncbi:MAG: hypothetical protein ACYS8Z_12000 [Planctomycetota bacterium]|jgi:transposase